MEAQKGPVNSVVERNIQDILEARNEVLRKQSFHEKLAYRVTTAAGKTWLAYLHAMWFTVWIAWNLLDPSPFDPFPFALLTSIVSLESIFLTLLILVSQKREAELEEQQTDLDLQINLLAEHEITRIFCAVNAIAEKMGIEIPCDPADAELMDDVRPRDVIQKIAKDSQPAPETE